MISVLPLVIALVGIAAAVWFGVAWRKRVRTDAPMQLNPEVFVNRMVVAAGIAAAAVFVFFFLDPFSVQERKWFGLGLALAPGISAIVGCVIIAAVPLPRWRVDASGRRTAQLTPRGAASFGPRWAFTLPLAAGLALVLFLLATGLTASTDEAGLSRMISLSSAPGESGSAGPYPGWYYGVPVIALTVLLAAVVLLALHRIASAPKPQDAASWELDAALRRSATRFVMSLSTSALLFYFGGLLYFAGSSTSNVASVASLRNPADETLDSGSFVFSFVQPAYAVGVAEMVIGGVLAATAVALAVSAVAATRYRLGSAASTPLPTTTAGVS
jgi:hypothetical protein